ncbi:hypothetical protein WS72_07800 [Burkholderia savannae]|uniref:Uncharacterized protein n=1 Tax=Burkholderia savannae TaxID=1637837 RepID=A0ABR5TD52_9BURK|nr:hypothetical protein WS72_07800 [Burkholderia savannae]
MSAGRSHDETGAGAPVFFVDAIRWRLRSRRCGVVACEAGAHVGGFAAARGGVCADGFAERQGR